jgi:hypothetical protein
MAKKSELIRDDIRRTRTAMGETLDALAAQADLKSRAKGWLVAKKETVTLAPRSLLAKLPGRTGRAVAEWSSVSNPGGAHTRAEGRDGTESRGGGIPTAGSFRPRGS